MPGDSHGIFKVPEGQAWELLQSIQQEAHFIMATVFLLSSMR